MSAAEDRARQLLDQARRLASIGRTDEATSLLRTLLGNLGRGSPLKDLRQEAFSGLIQIELAEGKVTRAAKSFRHAVAEFCGDPDPSFDEFYLTGCLATGTPPIPLRRRNRFLNLIRKLDDVRDREGAVAECGCFRGLSSFLMCSRLRQHRADFDGTGYEIYDSFRGLSESQVEDEPENPDDPEAARVKAMNRPGAFAASIADVRRALASFPGIAYFEGWIPETFSKESARQYRFVHVDVDLYQPTIDSFRYFWPRLVPGGRMVCDDYNWAGAKRAVEEFCAEAGVRFEVTPSFQAYFAKPE